MNATTITLVQSSFKKVVPIADKAAEIFYSKLFEKDPSLKPMFAHASMEEQGKKLMTMIGTAVSGLTHLDKIVPVVQDLGRKHVGYGVKDEHYDTVGAALIETLEVGLGDDFTDDVKAGWVEVYTLLATTMKDAAKEVEESAEGDLTDRQIKLVEDTFAKVAPIAETAADIFYTKLFEKDPSLRPMFSNLDMKTQGKKLMTMLGTAVGGLRNLPAIISVVQDLGKRHVGYGVKDEHYDTVGAALLDTLEAGLGEDFTPPVKVAWTKVYVTLATVMKEAAASVEDEIVMTASEQPKKWYAFWK